ncbi:hypothetical protein H4R33_001684 [Dimargaris cristalligena]|uniref:Prefoldin n=1 Tax=Dimargaris cristalligena TaxID=215637 RepID=A0A4Q0A493_9FUNG|nr:hypothetical protein H4R33_001684 [Dimargaris cristalligena]RKP40080.1 hypothetical protein BJ085DRAFT_34224 [Dimargaris cristalligena]|eukprot:RKP40080.1 hypothetical protein BJ085DRAFT_34224 [Dimargaris cristalligena]
MSDIAAMNDELALLQKKQQESMVLQSELENLKDTRKLYTSRAPGGIFFVDKRQTIQTRNQASQKELTKKIQDLEKKTGPREQ